jgi:hypothetical protein
MDKKRQTRFAYFPVARRRLQQGVTARIREIADCQLRIADSGVVEGSWFLDEADHDFIGM